jgi:hypothetical protein
MTAALRGANEYFEKLGITHEYLYLARDLSLEAGPTDRSVVGLMLSERAHASLVEMATLIENLSEVANTTLSEDVEALLGRAGEALDAVIEAGFRARTEDRQPLVDARGELTQAYFMLQQELSAMEGIDIASAPDETIARHGQLTTDQYAVSIMRDIARNALSIVADLDACDVLHVQAEVGDPNPDARVAGKTEMGDTASSLAGPGHQWLHMLARWLGGLDKRDNFATGPAGVNSAMISLERALHELHTQKIPARVDIACLLDRESRVGFEIRYRVFVGDELKADVSFDLSRTEWLTEDVREEISETFADMKERLREGRSPDESVEKIATLVSHKKHRLEN